MSNGGLLNKILDDDGEVADLEEVPSQEQSFLTTPLPIDPESCISEDWLARQNFSDSPLVMLDADFHIQWRNESFRTFRETPGLEYRGRPFFALFSNFAEASVRTELITSLKNANSGYSWQGQVDGRGHDNRLFKADISIIPIKFDSKGEPEWYLAIVTDLTVAIKTMIRTHFDSILKASLLKDEDTGYHVQRVNAYSECLAAALKGGKRWVEVDDDFIEDIGYLAAYHDVGKIGTPESILLKNGKLNDEEWQVMREHPVNGALILDAHPNSMAKEIARSHHERWDGKGYPFGLESEDIPLAGRIVMIADVYDALRTKRPYKEPFSEEKAFSIIVEDAGSHFDPHIIKVFVSLKNDFNVIFNKLDG